MKYVQHTVSTRGFTFVELLVTVAVIGLVFTGLIASIHYTMKLISNTKTATSALALANERIEYIRSLSYANVGTAGGIPDGPIPQNSTTTLNNVLFHERVLIQYVDSDDDGAGGADVNGILADYKEVKVEYSWNDLNGTSTIFILTNVVPPGIESTTGGGTLTVNVFDAGVLPVSGAEVRIYNDTTTSTIDTLRYTNVSGIAMFAGAPEAANYQITVTKPDFSTDQTYSATTSNPNPATPHVAVLESAVSTMNFQIDELSDLLVRTVEPINNGAFSDDFDDMTNVFLSVSTEATLGDLVLLGGAGSYAGLGSALSIPEAPGVLMSWSDVVWDATTPVNTGLVIQVYEVTGTSTYALVPDGDLPGNSTGFTVSPVDISGLNVGTYSALALGATLTSTDVNATPTVDDWSLNYIISEPIIPSIPFTLTGSKVIGTTLAAAPIYKYSVSHSTDGSGEIQLVDLEWDFYNMVLDTGAYDIKEACPGVPYTLDPGVDETLKVTLIPSSARSIRISVVDASGDPIEEADVLLSRSGFTDSGETSSCGQIFFNSGIAAEIDYQVDVSAAGYVDQTITNIDIDGTESLLVTLSV